MPVMCEDLLYASYDERTYCMPVMCEDLLYASYDERTYCTPVCGKNRVTKKQSS